MQIRRDCLAKQCQSGIAIAASQVAQNLVVGPVFLEDVDDVLKHPRAPRHHRAGGGGVREPVVRGYVHRQPGKLRHGAREREAQQAGFGQLGIVIRSKKCKWDNSTARMRKHQLGFGPVGDFALTTYAQVLPLALLRLTEFGYQPVGNETDDMIAAIRSAERHHRDVIQIAVGHVEIIF